MTPSPYPAVREFAEHLRYERRLSPRTAEEYARDVDRFAAFLVPAAGRDPVALEPARAEALLGATTSHIRRYVIDGMPRWSTSAVRRSIASLRSFYGLQKREGYRGDNPADDVRQPKQEKRLPTVLTEDEAAKMLSTRIAGQHDFERTRNAAIIGLFYAAGIRRAELASLNFEDLELDARMMRVTGKGNKQRLVLLTQSAVALLEAYIVHRPRPDDGALFVVRAAHGKARRISTGYIGELFKGFAKMSGIEKHVTPHVMRHSFATHLLENGADIVTIKELLGHESLSTTQIYTNVSMKHMRASYDDAHPMDKMKDQ